MADKASKVVEDLPDWSQLEEHGVAINAPTPTQFNMPDPWAPAGNGQAPEHQPQPGGAAEPPPPAHSGE